MNLNTIILMAQGNEGSGTSTLLMLGAMAVVFYFFMIRPQVKRQKEQKNFREALKVGDSIVTIGGIHARITALQETTATIKVEDGSTLKLEKSAMVADFAAHQQQGGKR